MTETTGFNYMSWQKRSKNEKIEYLIRNEKNTDCVFVFKHDDSDVTTDDGRLTSHKWILIGASEVFKTMFNGNFKEDLEEIEIRDVKVGAFEKFLRFVYFADHEELESLSGSYIIDLVYLGKKYMMDNLVSYCNTTINKKLSSHQCTDEDLLDIFNYARLNEDVHLLETWKRAMSSFKPFKNIFPTTLFTLDIKQMYEFVQALKGIASESHRFRMIECYVKTTGVKIHAPEKSNDGANKELDTKNDKNTVDSKSEVETSNQIYLKLVIQNIAFNKMTVREFCVGPGKSELLTDAEKVEKFMDVCMRLPPYIKCYCGETIKI